ncbi:MAG TPA: fibronectin type III domain-containing protein [Steroidobacteraceae bacterium]
MTNAKRGRGSRRGFYLWVVAALGFALSGCGGGAAGAASTGASSASSVDPPTGNDGDVTLNWMPPTENTNGSALTNLAGYNIHYGTSSGDYTQSVPVSNPGIATYVVDNLTPGTYYFSVGAVNSQGVESPLSSEVSATVN